MKKNIRTENQGLFPQMDERKNYSAHGFKWLEDILLSFVRI